MKNAFLFVLAVGIPLFTGCANLNSVHRDFNVSDGNGALIDIKQRAILSAVVETKTEDGKTIRETRVCAEPSPDALSAYAAELAAKGGGEAAASLSAAFRESSAYVGLRTQSIQLLRDASYRLCEAYLSGAIDAQNYQWLLRRFQRNMVALLTVEQLTGAVRAPSVTVNAQRQAEAAKSLSEILALKEKKDTEIKALEAENKELGKDAEKNKNKIEENRNKIGKLDSESETIGNAVSMLTSGWTTASGGKAEQSVQQNQAVKDGIAKTVKEIALNVLNVNDLPQLCFNYLSSGKKNATLTPLCEHALLRYSSQTRTSSDTLSDIPPHREQENKK